MSGYAAAVLDRPDIEDEWVVFDESVVAADEPTPVEPEMIEVDSEPTRPTFEHHLEHGTDGWIVEDRVTGIFGCADDLHDAVDDFGRAVRDHFAVLSRQGTLSPGLQEQFEYLKARLH